MKNGDVRETLFSLAEENYAAFSGALLPGVRGILGVRLPKLRKLAKTLAQNNPPFQAPADGYFEEIMLEGMVVGLLPGTTAEKLTRLASFVPKIDNWSVCDSFCAGLSWVKDDRKEVWAFLQPYFSAQQEFYARFGYVMLLQYFVTAEYLPQAFGALSRCEAKGYYAQMGKAWAISVCFAKFPTETKVFLQNTALSPEVRALALRKIRESTRVSPEEKARLVR